jgi:aspartyl-tRNA(Asn)/glutamyl-tRNA(Gln) amidotransferase subunit B
LSSFEPVIGLEVHAELSTQSKMFCACPLPDPLQAEPNTCVCEICLGFPGSLPAINEQAVALALKVALALECQIAERSVFARKNYFYPDLPKGFQISQYELPLASNGRLILDLPGGEKIVRIRRIHLEEDTGKLLHANGYSLVDFNRSGVPLLEIVTEPDLRSIDEVRAYATELRSMLRYLQVTSGDMEKGAIRFEANVSIRPTNSTSLGARTEIKNLNSFRAMLKALDFEIARQQQVTLSGRHVLQETLGWDEARGVTVPQRGKEEAHDYRYFPEPDLPVLRVPPEWLAALRSAQPELPYARRRRFQSEYRLSSYQADVMTAERPAAEYFEQAVALASAVEAQTVANWISGELFGLLNQSGLDIAACPLPPSVLAELLQLLNAGKINPPTAKALLAEVFEHGGSPAAIVKARGLQQLSDQAAIGSLVDQVLQSSPDQVSQYLAGKRSLSRWLFGQVMRAAKGQAEPASVQAVLDARLQALEDRRQRP